MISQGEPRTMSTTSNQNKQRAGGSTYKILRLLVGLALVIATLSATGCMDALMYAARQSEMSGTYSELKQSMTPPPSGSGRLIVYVAGRGPDAIWWGGSLMSACTVDEDCYGIRGASYWYVDIPSGKHKVTADGVEGALKYGKNAVEFELQENETKYCKIDVSTGIFATLTPAMIEPSVAEKELATLSFFKKFKLNKKVK